LLVELTASPAAGPAPLTVNFDVPKVVDSGAGVVSWALDFDGDGVRGSGLPPARTAFTYVEPGTYVATVTVRDSQGRMANSRPVVVRVDWPGEGDYYTVLGVSPRASSHDIKKAYRNLARRLHPDRNPAPDAAERFRAVTAAYQVLGSNVERRAYDRARGYRA
jgi:hypothetical protein